MSIYKDSSGDKSSVSCCLQPQHPTVGCAGWHVFMQLMHNNLILFKTCNSLTDSRSGYWVQNLKGGV